MAERAAFAGSPNRPLRKLLPRYPFVFICPITDSTAARRSGAVRQWYARTVDIDRAAIKTGMIDPVYNFSRPVWLEGKTSPA